MSALHRERDRKRQRQYVAVYCIVLQCVAVCKDQCATQRKREESKRQYVGICCSELQHVAACSSILQRLAACCSDLQYLKIRVLHNNENMYDMRHVNVT